MKNILEVKNLTKKYKEFTLDSVNLSIPEGCIMGFIGANGAGKSTTIKSILNIIIPDSGEITVFGENDLSKNHALKEHIGVVMDQSTFPETLTSKQINQIMKCSYRTWNEEKFFELMKKFRISDKKKVKEYSRGMTMKLSIAVALSHDSKLLILDEATSGLDPIIRDEILDIFLDFIQDETKSVLISSHILSDLEKVCDYITFIHDGRIVLSEEKDVLLDSYCVVKCDSKELSKVDSEHVKGIRHGTFGEEALVLRDGAKVIQEGCVEPATLEDIMLYMVKGEK
ncbi:MAG: ABC transporter ATP-binding protein [Eubacteriales bacterium]